MGKKYNLFEKTLYDFAKIAKKISIKLICQFAYNQQVIKYSGYFLKTEEKKPLKQERCLL